MIRGQTTYKYANRWIILILMFSFAFITLSTVNTVSADSSIIYVNDSGGNDDWDGFSWEFAKKSIKNATGTVTNGGTVNIADGTYTGENNTNLVIDKNMKINGQSKDDTIINGTNLTRIFTIKKGKNVTIQNLTLANGNSADYGGAIYNNGTLTINGIIFLENRAIWNGGAIYNDVGGNLIINNTDFVDNTVNGDGVWYSWTEGGAIYNNGNLTVTNSNFESNSAIHYGGAIFNDKGGNLKVIGNIFADNSVTLQMGGGGTLNGFSTFFPSGGAIYNAGNLVVSDNMFRENTAQYGAGGAINNVNNMIVTGNVFYNNNATWGGAILNDGGTSTIPAKISGNVFLSNNAIQYGVGGAIYNFANGKLTIVGSNFINNTTSHGQGGAIYNQGTLNVNGSDFTGNIATDEGRGGAIYNLYGTTTIHFSRIVGNTANYSSSETIFNSGGTVNANYNWWGSNKGPLVSEITGTTVSSWLVLTLNVNPNLIKVNGVSTITADLLHDNHGNYNDPAKGHVPDGIPFTFSTTLGNIDDHAYTVNGIARATFNCDIPGTATITTSDTQTTFINSYVTVVTDTTSPTVTTNHPSGAYNNVKTVTLTATDNFDLNPEIYYSTNNGVTWNHQAKTVTLNLNQGKTVLMFYAKDSSGNQCPTQTLTYNIDTIAPKIITTTPKNGATGVSRTSIIAIRLSENVKAGINWSKIIVKNKYGKVVSITKWISGNMLYIKTTYKRTSYSYYTVYIPASALKDNVGNNAAGYIFRFKTGRY